MLIIRSEFSLLLLYYIGYTRKILTWKQGVVIQCKLGIIMR